MPKDRLSTEEVASLAAVTEVAAEGQPPKLLKRSYLWLKIPQFFL